MIKHLFSVAALSLGLSLIACGGEDSENNNTDTSSSGGSADGSSSGGGTDGSSSGGGTDGSSSSGGGSTDGGGECEAARTEALGEKDAVSDGQVVKINGEVDSAEGALIWVQAHAGGHMQAANNPRVYLKLADVSKVAISDIASRTNTSWDLTLKRTNLFTNSGTGGPGNGGGQVVSKEFAQVTAADATAIAAEDFFDDNCEVKLKSFGPGVSIPGSYDTSLSDWYSYEQGGPGVVVVPNKTLIVRAAASADLYKVQVVSYRGNQDGTEGETTGNFLLRVGKL